MEQSVEDVQHAAMVQNMYLFMYYTDPTLLEQII
jgi:hypothetical protein